MTEADRREFLQRTAGAMAAWTLMPGAEQLEARLSARGAPLGVALVGAGRQGSAILAELQKIEQVEVVSVCDTVDGRLRSGLRRARGAEGVDDYRRVLDDARVGAVVVATPTHLHEPIAVAALAAGKHVYCEAPLAATADSARAIARAARNAKTVFQSGMLARSNPIYRLARSFFASGSLREVVALQAQDHSKTSWRTPASDPARDKEMNWRLDPEVSGGLVGELGTHQFDVMHWFLRQYPTAVRGSGSIRLYRDGREMPDTVQCDVAFADGTHLDWRGTLCSSHGGRFEALFGSMATMKLAWTAGWMFKEAEAPTQGWEVYANRETFHNDQGITLIADATKLAEQGKLKEGVGLPNPPLYYGLVDFVKSVTEGAEVVCTAEEGMRAAIVGASAHRAVVSGEEVRIDPKELEVG